MIVETGGRPARDTERTEAKVFLPMPQISNWGMALGEENTGGEE